MLVRKLPVLLLLAAAGFFLAPAALAAPLPPDLEENCVLVGCDIAYWSEDSGGNGHYYAFVPSEATLSWADAQALAQASSLGAGSVGQLVSITSALENSFVVDNVLPGATTIGHKNQVWIGGVQTSPAGAPADGWEWVTPETWDYTNWLPGEPNDENADHTGDERYLSMWVHYYLDAIDRRGTWNDEDFVPNAQAPLLGVIIEFEAAEVPEPATFALFALGAGLLALGRHSRRV